MKQIAIPCKGEVFIALVDDEDYPVVSRHTWAILWSGRRPYAFTRLYNENKKNGKTFLMHHLILGISSMTDHRNNNSLDNQKANLRPATRQQNSANVPKFKTKNGKPCSSKYKGVHKYASNGKFRATIGYNKKIIQLGTFVHEDDAGRAYNEKAKELFGDYACLNDIPERPTV
jgi:hypothetical protein